MNIVDVSGLHEVRKHGLAKLQPGRPRIAVGTGTCGVGNGAEEVFQAMADILRQKGMDILLTRTGCFGFCAREPLVNVQLPGKPLVILQRVTAEDAERIIESVVKGRIPEELALCRIDSWDFLTGQLEFGRGFETIPLWNEIPFYTPQQKIVLRDCGLINPEDIEEYIAIGGYAALVEATHSMDPLSVIEEVKRAGLRGRGGAGYPTGKKWEVLRQQKADQKYIICNADEGDPGAYMNRNEIESDPHMLIEGMILGGYATGATQGIVYVRAEYPLAVQRLKIAIEEARNHGLLGRQILGSTFDFDLTLVEGAGAFVCGEETALIASLEGKAGRPRPRPPFPAQKGLWGKPTNINNVETWCNIPAIMAKGGEWFAGTGMPGCTGTKVFSLVGKVKNTGLVEMPLGSPLKTIVFGIGEGTGTAKKVKAVQTGGPSGGCIPMSLFETPVDYESLGKLGSIMGSGGIVVMDEDNCMVDVARYFIEFTHSESCGKCIPCRVGLDHALRILNAVASGHAVMEDLAMLEDLGNLIRETSLCGLGQSAPNPVLTTLRYFRREYEEHIKMRRCTAGVCGDLSLSPCENSCPLHMNIPGFLQLMKEGRIEDAFELVLLDNPLPASTGRVCQHPCENRCRRATVDAPVNMREVHRYIADTVFANGMREAMSERFQARRLEGTSKSVGIVGAGPAGLTAAFYLALLGHEVKLYDAALEPGGMLRYALPEYRLPKDVLDQEFQFIHDLGVEFIGEKRFGKEQSLEAMTTWHDALFLAVGTWREMGLDIPGVELAGVRHALGFLHEVSLGERPKLGGKVIVIGGGNAAIDSARTALRLGAEVTIVYRRERADMPAIAQEVEEAIEEGVELRLLGAPKRIVGDAAGNVTGIEVARTRLGDIDASGRRTPIALEESDTIECSTVLLAIGEKADSDTLREFGLKMEKNGTLAVDPFTFQTSHPKIFAGGDLVTGASNVTSAMAQGKRAASTIDRRLMGEERLERLWRRIPYEDTVPREPDPAPRHTGRVVEAGARRACFEEVALGLSDIDAIGESMRCLRCDVKAGAAQNQPSHLVLSGG